MKQYYFYIEIPESVKEILFVLHNRGYEAYIVGGSVRDSFLGKKPNDFDITTNAKPYEMKEIFSPHFKVIESGIKHGTLTVINRNYSVEVTTYRIDGEYLNNRKPENVTFTGKLFEDLKRRDFTINALVYSDNAGICDYFGGIDDINDKTIRCIGNPEKRFNEDALRILRAIRFSAKLDFNIQEDTRNAIHLLSPLLNNISGERIFTELLTLFTYTTTTRTISSLLIEYKDVLETALSVPFNVLDYNQKCEISFRVSCENDLRFKLYLCLVSENLEILKKILERLKVSNSFKNDVFVIYECINNREVLECSNLYLTKRIVNKYGLSSSLLVAKAVFAINNNKDFLYFINEIIRDKLCTDIKSLKVSGEDLIFKFNISGKQIGLVLNELLLLVMEDKISNEKESLLKKANDLINTMLV